MSLKEDVLKASEPHLRMDQIVESLSEEDRQDLEELLDDERIKASVIAQVLRERDFSISDRTIQRHRQKRKEELDRIKRREELHGQA